MKKILLVSCDGLGNGGVQAVMMSIVRELHHEYHFDIVLFTDEERRYDGEFLSYGGSIFRIPRYNGSNGFHKKIDYYIRGKHVHDELKKLLKEHGPYEAIHCHDEYENGPILKAAFEEKVPIRIAHTHIINNKSNIVAEFLEGSRRKAIQKYATAKIGCSREACNAYYSCPDEALVVNNPINEKRFNKKGFQSERKNSLSLVQIGSYNPTKNQLFSIAVINEIVSKHKDAHLYLVGFQMGDYVTKIEAAIKDNGLTENVTLLPGDYDTPRLLNESSYLIMPSHKEGFGIVLIEAQAMGVKCFASEGIPRTTDCGGVKYLSLQAGPSAWADEIIKDYIITGGEHYNYNIDKFSTVEIMDVYRRLYEGNLVCGLVL